MANMFDDIDPQQGQVAKQDEGDYAGTPTAKNMFDDLPDVQEGKSSGIGAFAASAARGVLPAAGGLAAAGAGAEAGGAVGSLFGPIGAAVGAFGGGLAGFFGGSAATEGAQDWAIKQAPDNWQEALGQGARSQRLQEEKHPYYSMLGGLLPYTLTMSPGAFTTKAAGLTENATNFQRLMANPVTARVFGGAAMGGMELGQEEYNGQTPDWAKVGISTGFGLIFNKPTKFGEALHNFGAGVDANAPNAKAQAVIDMLGGEPEQRPQVPTVAQAADLGVMGPGVTESTFQGGQEQSPETRITAHNMASDEQTVTGQPPAPDLHVIARRMDPDLFNQNDELLARRDSLRQFIENQSNPTDEMFDDIALKRSQVEESLRNANPRSPDAKNYRAEIADLDAQVNDLNDRREAWANGTHVDTPEITLARQHLLDTEHELWDMGPQISSAMRRAADHAGQFEEETPAEAAQPAPATVAEQPAETPVAEGPAQGALPLHGDANKSPEAQRAAIVSDSTAKLVAAGMPREQAVANASIEAAYYETLAHRFEGKLGTAEELYRARSANVIGPRGVSPAETAGPAPRVRPAKEIARDMGIRNTEENAPRIAEVQKEEMAAATDHAAAASAPATRPAAAETAPLLPTTPTAEIAPHTPASGNGGLESLDPADINVDADRFQFKAGGDESGVTERLQGVQKWDARLAGTVLVFRDADGKLWIADGHQRLGLAKRLAAEGQEGIRLNAFVLDAKDGITDADARSIAAAKNIAEGTGTAVDAAKIIREAAEHGIDLPPLPPRSTLARDGKALANLSPDAFGMAVNDVIPVGQAAIVGRLIADHAQQEEAIRVLSKTKPENLRQAEMVVREVMETGFGEGTQESLFGAEHFATSTVLERAKIADEAMRQLSRDRTTFRTLVGEAERIQAHGENTLDLEANQSRLTADEQAKQLLTQLATRKGPVSDALTGIAGRLKSGDISRAAAAREFLDVIRANVPGELGEGANAGGAEHGAAAEPELAGQRELLQGAQGKIRLSDAGATISLMRTADASTFMHETAHHWLEQLMADAAHELAPDSLKSDAQTVRKWLGLKQNADRIPTAKHEKFARGFEQYIREGVAPSKPLARVFAQFKDWLTKIYQTTQGLGAPISEEIRGVFDRMLSTDPQRTVYAPERESAEGIGAAHERDAAETAPHEADATADRISSERSRYVEEQKPEIVSELEAAGPKPEEGAGGEPGANESAGEAGGGPQGSSAVASRRSESEPESAGGRGGAERGAQRGGGGSASSERAELSGGSDKRPNAGVNPGVEQFAPRPATSFADREPDLVDKAGNIRVENLTDVKDIATAIHDSADRNGEFANVRGGMTKGQMLDLANSMGLDVNKVDEGVLTRMFGGTADLGAKVLAARKLVVDSAGIVANAMKTAAQTGADHDVAALGVAIARHDMIQSALAGVTAEWGRAGSAFHSLLSGWETAKDVNQILKDNLGRDLFQLKMIAKLGKSLDTPGKVSKFLRDAKKRTFGGMLLEYWINGLISGPSTHATYAVGNVILAAEKAGPETAAAAAIGALRSRFGREGTRVRMGEVGAQFRAAFREAPAAAQAALEAVRSGQTTLLPGETAHALTPFEGDTHLAYGRSQVERTTEYRRAYDESIDRQAREEAAKGRLGGLASEKDIDALKQNATLEMKAQADIDAKAAASTVNPVTWAEVRGDAFGMIQGMRDGIVAAGELAKNGGDPTAPMFSADYSPLGQIPDIKVKGVNVLPLGTLARLPSRSVAAIHSTFRSMNYSMEINALAFRQAAEEGLTGTDLASRAAELRQNPSEAMMEQARTKATDLTLMSQGSDFVQRLQKLTQWEGPGGIQYLKFVEPFVAIAANIMDQSLVQRTPVGLLSGEIRADLMGKNGNIAQDTAMAKMLVGSSLGMLFGGLAAQGLASGSGPSDPNKAAMWRLAGNQAHSVRIGDMWYDVHRLGPVGMLGSVAADMYDVAHQIGTEDASTVGKSIMHAFTQSILDESFMRGPSDLIKALTDPDRYGSSYVRNMLASFLPYSVGAAQIARASDPYSRQARSIMDEIRLKIPGLSEGLLARRDIWGEKMPSGDALGGAGVTAIYATRMSHDPVNQALLNLGVGPAPVPREIRNVKLTDEQYDQFAEKAGRMAKMRLDAIVNSEDFQSWPKSTQFEVIEESIKQSREAARGWMMMRYPQIVSDATQYTIKKRTGGNE